VGAVGQDEQALVVGQLAQLLERHDEAGDEHGVADADHPRPGRDRGGEGPDDLVDRPGRRAERDFLDREAGPLLLEPPGADVAGVLQVRHQDLVPGLEVEAVDDEVEAFGRVAGQRDLVGRGVDERGQLGPDGFPEGRQEVVTVERVADLDAEVLHQGVENALGHGPERPVVHHDEAVVEFVELADLLPIDAVGRLVVEVLLVERGDLLSDPGVELVEGGDREGRAGEKVFGEIPARQA